MNNKCATLFATKACILLKNYKTIILFNMNPTPTSGPRPNTDRLQTIKDFIARADSGFICSFGRTALTLGRLDIIMLPRAIPALNSNFHPHSMLDTHRLLMSATHKLLQGELDGLVFVDPSDGADHKLAELKAWQFYCEVQLALLRHDRSRYSIDENSLPRHGVNQIVNSICDPEQFQTSPPNTVLKGPDYKTFFLTAMNPLYRNGYPLHPRLAPCTLYAVVPTVKISSAKRDYPAAMEKIREQISIDFWNGINGNLPYIIPGDIRYLSPPLQIMFRVVSEVGKHPTTGDNLDPHITTLRLLRLFSSGSLAWTEKRGLTPELISEILRRPPSAR